MLFVVISHGFLLSGGAARVSARQPGAVAAPSAAGVAGTASVGQGTRAAEAWAASNPVFVHF